MEKCSSAKVVPPDVNLSGEKFFTDYQTNSEKHGAVNKISDQATKERLLYGNWDFVEANDMALYNQFDGTKHLITGLREKVYDPTKPLIAVWDFNVAPYLSTLEEAIPPKAHRKFGHNRRPSRIAAFNHQ